MVIDAANFFTTIGTVGVGGGMEIKMDLALALNKVRKKGIKGTLKYCRKKVKSLKIEKTYTILLLTNRDSDNVGDQVIEACDISLIKAAMKNLNIRKGNYEIKSRAAGIISKKYLATEDPKLLKSADKLIRESDVIIFGGAPLFNYLYQPFYERTAVTLEIAEKYNKPVIFSAIGVEGYDEHNPKCQRLKRTLNFDCVKQITTRDDLASLQKYKENELIKVEKVSDPAVFTIKVLEKYMASKEVNVSNKKIGIFILRANGFKDNKVDFSRSDAAGLWKGIIHQIENRGFEYELLTSGHFGDEAFLDHLINQYGMKAEKCIFNMNSPEKLIRKISSYDAVISTRLHPSIISFSLGVPSIGIVWNSKVKHFYNSIGYEDRAIEVNDITPEEIIEKVEQAIDQGVAKDEKYLMSVYNSLFYGLKRLLHPAESNIMPYKYSELMKKLPTFRGTSKEEQEKKIQRKFKRTYGAYNKLVKNNLEYKEMINELTSKLNEDKQR